MNQPSLVNLSPKCERDVCLSENTLQQEVSQVSSDSLKVEGRLKAAHSANKNTSFSMKSGKEICLEKSDAEENLSVNYLSEICVRKKEIPFTITNNFVLTLRNKVPVIQKDQLGLFFNLKELLRDYFFGSLSHRSDYQLSFKELQVLKFLLKKKIMFSNSKQKIRRIDTLAQSNVADFLRENPPRKRTQIFKRTVFSCFWRFASHKSMDLIQKFFNGDRSFDYLKELSNNKGNMRNLFFKRCFDNPEFRKKFVEICLSHDFWVFCNRKSVDVFEKNIDGWLEKVTLLLSGEFNREEEKKVLMKIKFLPSLPSFDRIRKVFKL